MSTAQVLTMAEQLEIVGERAYRQFAGCAADEALKALFLKLADDEIEHRESFRRMREQLDGGMVPPVEFSHEQISELHEILVAQGQRDPSEALEQTAASATGAELLQRAIDFERAAVALFTKVGKYVTDPRGTRVIQSIIAEELEHIENLRGRLPAAQ